MSFDQINDRIQTMGGRWAKLTHTGDKLVGTLLEADETERTDPDGDVVRSKKTGEPRKVWNLTLQTDERADSDDDGVRKFSANESCQGAIGKAVKEQGVRLGVGCTIKIGVTAENGEFEQCDYKVVLEKGADPAIIAATEAADNEAADDLGF